MINKCNSFFYYNSQVVTISTNHRKKADKFKYFFKFKIGLLEVC